MRVLQRELSGHVIVAGHGTSGTEAVAELIRRGRAPEEIVVIDSDTGSLEQAEREGVRCWRATPPATRRWKRCGSTARARWWCRRGATTRRF